MKDNLFHAAPAGAALTHIALIGNALPRRCGIATFTSDTCEAIRMRFPALRIDLYAMDDGMVEGYPDHIVRIEQHNLDAYYAAAERISASGAQALWIQHEYGIYGGVAGEFILDLVRRVPIPLIATLHTILENPSSDEKRVMEVLAHRTSRLIVMAEKGREILKRLYDVRDERIAFLPHGVPDRPFSDSSHFKKHLNLEDRKIILTSGLLAPDKGIETMIRSLPDIVSEHADALYIILGATHPNLASKDGETYRDTLQALANKLGVHDHVMFVNDFVSQDVLLDYLQASDIYVAPYLNKAQITSGTLSYALAVGKPIVATPFHHANELLGDNCGIMVDFANPQELSRAIIALLDSSLLRDSIGHRAYQRGRTMLWAVVAERAIALINGIIVPGHAQEMRVDDPPAASVDLASIARMSDNTGILQHSILSVPDRRHGYCLDDNARALILCGMAEDVDERERDRLMTIYASFVENSWNQDVGSFRNFMTYDRHWTEEKGSDDSYGRALWALGVTAQHARSHRHSEWAEDLFNRSIGNASALQAPRALSFAMLGAAAILATQPNHRSARRFAQTSGDRLLDLLVRSRRPDWPWFETMLAYDNARLPEALLRSSIVLERDDYRAAGLETLEWIIDQQLAPRGHFRAVGTDSFGREYQAPLPFDQQPLETQATVDACDAAFLVSADHRWIATAQRIYLWFMGENDRGTSLATGTGGSCYDGLTPTGVNRNQGAESILALQLASCTISRLHKAGKAAAISRNAA